MCGFVCVVVRGFGCVVVRGDGRVVEGVGSLGSDVGNKVVMEVGMT